MMVCITAQAPGLDAPVEPRFVHAPFFVFIETETGEVHPVANALCGGGVGGAGPRVVQFIAEYGAEVLVTGRLGGHAEQALGEAGIPIVEFTGERTVEDALRAFRLCALRELA